MIERVSKRSDAISDINQRLMEFNSKRKNQNRNKVIE